MTYLVNLCQILCRVSARSCLLHLLLHLRRQICLTFFKPSLSSPPSFPLFPPPLWLRAGAMRRRRSNAASYYFPFGEFFFVLLQRSTPRYSRFFFKKKNLYLPTYEQIFSCQINEFVQLITRSFQTKVTFIRAANDISSYCSDCGPPLL